MAAGIGGRILWGIVADRWHARTLLGWLGVSMSAAALLTAAIAPQWPTVAVLAVSLVFGATAVGWNGVFLAEVAQMVPAREAGAATGASLAMTYAGVVIVPLLFWAILLASDSYAAGYCVSAALTLWRSAALFKRAP